MSKIFKSSHVNVGQPLEVIMHEEQIIHKKRVPSAPRHTEFNEQEAANAASAIIEEANTEAEEIIQRAREEAQQLLQAAERDAQTIRSNAEENGYQQGLQQGIEDGRRETEDLAHETLQIKEELEAEKYRIATSLEPQVVNLIVQSVRKIIGRELSTQRDIILDVVSKALNKIMSGGSVTVRVSDEDFDILTQNKNKVLAECDEVTEFDIKKDPSLDMGGCVIDTDCGSIEASVETQIEKLEEVMSELLGNDANDR